MSRTFDPISLHLFIAVCEEGNIARAAEREAIVASAVSKRIAAIEAQIGAPLLTRGRRGIEPTAAGHALLRQARDVLGVMARMHAELSEFVSGVQGSLRVVAATSVLAESLVADIGTFLARYPAVRVSLDERVSPDIVRAVREGSADIGVLWNAPDGIDLRGLDTVAYRSDHLCLAMHTGHTLSARKRISFANCIDHISVGVAPGGTTDVLLRREAARLGRTLAYRMQVSSMDVAARIVAAGLGPAVLPREAIAAHAAAASLAMVTLSDSWARRHFVVCTRAGGGLPATVRLLVEHLRSVALAVSPATNDVGSQRVKAPQ